MLVRSDIKASQSFDVTSWHVLAIAAPMAVAYMTTPILGLVDTAVVGRMGDAALIGGLAAGALVFDVMFGTLNSLRSGTTGLVAQAFGRGDEREETAIFYRALLLAIMAGLVVMVSMPAVLWGAIRVIAPQADVVDAMVSYVGIRTVAAPLTLMNYVILGYVIGRGEGRLGLYLQLVLNGTNIILSILFGLVLGWGVAGVAWGTVGGELAAVLVGGMILKSRFKTREAIPFRRVLDWDQLRKMLSLNGDIMVRSFALLATFVLFTRQGAQLGTVALAANAVLMHLFYLAGYFLDGIATAAEQLVGRMLGAGREEACRKSIRLSVAWGFGLAFVAAFVFMIFGENLIQILTSSEDVQAMAIEYLPWAALTAITGVLAFLMDGIYIGATWSRDMRNMMLLSLALYAGFLLWLGPVLGNLGLWISFNLFLIARGVSLTVLLPKRLRLAFTPATLKAA